MLLEARELRGVFFAIGLLCATGTAVVAQTNGARNAAATRAANAPARLPSFEVASIKPVDPHGMHIVGVDVYPGGRVVLHTLTLKTMICVAFHLSYWQLSGGDPWTDKVSYNVEALPPENLRSSIQNTRHTLFGIGDKRLREMVQALLIDRLQLRFHRETKTGKVYLLERSGKPLRLQPTKAVPTGEHPSNAGGGIGFAGRWVLSNTTMPQLAKFASDYVLHRPVLDRTELGGSFDYKSEPEDWATEQEDHTGSFLNLIRETGLKFESGKGLVETFVIDYAEKPSPN